MSTDKLRPTLPGLQLDGKLSSPRACRENFSNTVSRCPAFSCKRQQHTQAQAIIARALGQALTIFGLSVVTPVAQSVASCKAGTGVAAKVCSELFFIAAPTLCRPHAFHKL